MLYQHYGVFDAPIAQGAAGTTQVLAGVPGFKIRVVGYTVVMTAAGTVKFQSASNDKTGPMSTALNGGVSSGTPFMCGNGEALNIVSTVGAANGHIAYQLIPA